MIGLNELRIALDAMGDGVILADARSGEVQANRAARELLELSRDAAVDTTELADLLGWDPIALAATAADRRAVSQEVQRGGRVLRAEITPLRDAGLAFGALVVLHELDAAADVPARRVEIAQVISHALKDSLASMTGALGLLSARDAGALSERQLRHVTMMRQSTAQMNQIIDQLLDLARAQAGSIQIAEGPVRLDRLAREVIDRYRGEAAHKRLALVLTASSGDSSLFGDSERLSQVLGNLLANAIRLAPTGSVIDVHVFGPTLAEDVVGVSVYNPGEPIALEDLEHWFDPFSPSSQSVDGTALGLSFARAIVEAHGGQLAVEPSATGTKLVLTLPAAARGHAAAPPSPPGPPAPLGERLAALVIDDDPRRAAELEALLAPLTERVLIAGDLDGALALARAERPPLCVVAAATPGVDDLLSILKHDPDTAATAVLVVGGSDRRAELIEAGADDVLDLPLQPAMFHEACRWLVEASRHEVPRVLIVDDEPTIRMICREVLERGGYQVREAGSANAALAEALRFRPDLIIFDVRMPDLDGFQCAELLRRNASIRWTPFMFLSAHDDAASTIRAFDIGAEDYLLKPFYAPELLARVNRALHRKAGELSATTQLPGPRLIQAETEQRLSRGDPTAVICYLDLDYLKAFNDYYSWAKANAAISQTADVIRAKVKQYGSPGDFIGHIAGDDFVVITSSSCVDELCAAICERFDHMIKYLYMRKDLESGFIEAQDRFGVQRRFPIMSISIAAITISRAKTYAALAELSAEGKRLAKAISGSSYVRDGHVLLPRGPARRAPE